MTVKEIKNEARERFTINRYKAMPAYCVVFFIVVNILVVSAALFALMEALNLPAVVSWIFFGYGGLLILLVIFFSGPFSYSMADFFMRAYKETDVTPALKFDGFGKLNFSRVVLAHLLHFAFTLLLTCLLIVPGIIFSIKTSMTFHLMRANPKLKPMAALKASSKVMKGHSAAYFKLSISFIGWFFLSIITLGTGFIYFLPYFNACKAIFYKRELQKDTSFLSQDDSSAVKESRSANAEITVSAEENTVTAEQIQEEPVVIAPVAEVEPVSVATEPINVEPETETSSEQAKSEHEIEPLETAEPIVVEPAAVEPVSAEPIEVTPVTARPAASKPEKSSPQTVSPQPAATRVTELPHIPAQPVKSVDDQAAEKSNSAKEAIRQRIEQLKRERGKHAARPQRPERKVRPEVKNPEPVRGTPGSVSPKVVDEFGPEKLDIEIVEEE